MHHHRVDPEELAGYFSLDDADRVLTANATRTPSIRLVREGSLLPEVEYTRGATLAGRQLTGLVDGRKAVEAFQAGATVVFQGLHRSFPPLVDLIARLELELGHPCQANAYLTPPGSRGFALHADTHDVFVLQTAGSKQWELRSSLDSDEVEEPLLEPGHVMYLPTGTLHAARARETVSLHITIGINQLTWRGLLRRAVADAVAEEPDQHLPAGYVSDPTVLGDLVADRMTALADRIRRADAHDVAWQEVRRFLTSRPPRLEGALVDGLLLDEVDSETLLRRRPGHPCVLAPAVSGSAERIEVLLGDRTLEVPAWLAPALTEVARRQEFRPRELPLDEQSSVVLAKRLVREGLLTVVAD